MKKSNRSSVIHLIMCLPVTLIAVGIVVFFNIPNPMMILIIPVVFFSYSGGYICGSISGLVAIAYSYYFFFIQTVDSAAVQKLTTILLAVVSIVILVGRLKARDLYRVAELMKIKDSHIAETEEAVETATRELELQINVAEKRRMEAEHSNRTKSEFLSRMSHEMRTPMNAIIGLTQVVKISAIPDEIRKPFDEIDAASRRLLGMIEDVLDFTDMEYGAFKLTSSVFDIREAFKDLTKMVDYYIVEKQHTFISDISPTVPLTLIGDKKRLMNVVNCLLVNAVKFTPENGKISLEAYTLNESGNVITLQITVTDNGIGVSKEKQDKLFDLFEQEDGSITRKHGGIGLGLTISKRIALMMGGDISVESELGKGSKFTFTCNLLKETEDMP